MTDQEYIKQLCAEIQELKRALAEIREIAHKTLGLTDPNP